MVRRIGPRGRVFAVVAVAGAVALSGQFAVDVVAGLLAEDRAEMAAITRGVRTTPGISLYFYDFGPYLFYFGQLTLVVLLALGRHVRPWTPLLVLAMPFVDKDLVPLGAVLLLVSFAPPVRKPVPVQGPIPSTSWSPLTGAASVFSTSTSSPTRSRAARSMSALCRRRAAPLAVVPRQPLTRRA